ncbi:MAG: cellulase family glycosylhydrolase [Chloroflexota bacterium]
MQPRHFQFLLVFCIVSSLSAFALTHAQANNTSLDTSITQTTPSTAHDLGKGINFANALEYANEGDGGVVLEEADFEVVKQAGFDTIRLPVSWPYHTDKQAPYTIDPAIFDRVDWAVDQAVQRDLNIIINIHYYDDLNNNPEAEKDRFLAIWRQVAEHYQDSSDHVYFEVFNEPHGAFNNAPDTWNEFFADAVAVIRESNPLRPIIGGPVIWNSVHWLGDFTIPDDPNIITTIHYYEPYAFTHQGAEWLNPSPPVGTAWTGNEPTLLWLTWSSRDISEEWQTSESGEDHFMVTFKEPNAWLQLRAPVAVQGYESLYMRVKGAFSLSAGCASQLQQVQTQDGWNDYYMDVSGCESIDDIVIQHNGQAQNPMLLSKLELHSADNVIDFLSTSAEYTKYLFDTLEAWAEKHNTSVFLGEFGTYYPGDLEERASWTDFIRAEAEARGFAWAYWELRAGFGVYDYSAKDWIEPLFDALMPSENPAHQGPSGEWTLTFEDEFDTLDTNIWHTMWGTADNYRDQVDWSNEIMKHDNVWAKDGNLIVRHQIREGQITSGVVTTQERFTQRHGYFEARMQMCQAQGVLNAFWLQRNPDLWPPEIDVVEILGKQITHPHTSLHYGYPEHHTVGSNKDMGVNYADGFHIFGVEWNTNELIWYVDGEEYWRTDNPGGNFDTHEMYVQLKMHSGNGWSGQPDMNDTTPCYMKVDYVRAWQRS